MKQSRIHRIATLAALIAGITLLCTSVQTAEARPRPARASGFEANKTFGIGLMLGAPTALSGKYFLSSDTALDFGVGVVSRWRNRDGLHLHMDFLWHPVSLVNAQPFAIPLYFGVGARIWDWNDNNNNTDDLSVGVRAPLGIAFDFNNVPLDIFLEVAFVLDLVGPVDGDFNGAVGIRYYFF